MRSDKLEAIAVTIHADEPSYSSFKSAVRAASETIRAQAARTHTQLLKGKRIERFHYSADKLTIFLSEKSSLTYWLEGGIVNWAVDDNQASIMQNEFDPLAAPQLLLKFENSSELFHWDRAEICAKFLRNQVRRVGACIAFAYLEIDTGEQLWLHRLSAGPRDFLFYDIEDAWVPKAKSSE